MRVHAFAVGTALLLLTTFASQAEAKENANLPLSNFVTRPNARSIRAEALKNRQNQELHAQRTTLASQVNLYENALLHFSIRYPKDWEVSELMDTEGRLTTIALFLSPLEGEKDASRENVSAMTEDLTDSRLSMQDYTTQAIANEEHLFDSYTLLSSTDTYLAGNPAHSITYSAGFQDKILMFEQYWTIFRGKMYVWTLAAPAETFDRYSAMFHDMLSTFTFES